MTLLLTIWGPTLTLLQGERKYYKGPNYTYSLADLATKPTYPLFLEFFPALDYPTATLKFEFDCLGAASVFPSLVVVSDWD